MFPLVDDVHKSWFGKATWSLILVTSALSIAVFRLPLTTQEVVVINCTVTHWGESTLGNLYFRMLIATHLHADFFHLFFNMLFLFAFGLSLEKELGASRFL